MKHPGGLMGIIHGYGHLSQNMNQYSISQKKETIKYRLEFWEQSIMVLIFMIGIQHMMINADTDCADHLLGSLMILGQQGKQPLVTEKFTRLALGFGNAVRTCKENIFRFNPYPVDPEWYVL